MRLVDADALLKRMEKRWKNLCAEYGSRDPYASGFEEGMVAVEDAESECAHWIIDKGGDWGECSRCHEASKLSVMEHKDYCPACGAHMIEEVETDGR